MSRQITVTKKKALAKKKLVIKKRKAAAKKMATQKKKTAVRVKLLKAKLKAKKIQLAKWNKTKKKATPKKRTVKKVKVGSLLTKKDEKYMKEKSMATIAVLIDGERFMVSKQHMIPKNAKIQRDGQGQVTGMKAIGSG